METNEIQMELNRIQKSSYANKTDKQLMYYEHQSLLHKEQCKGRQPEALKKYNRSENRKCKLNIIQVREIRKKYNPYVYGKVKLGLEYGVSPSVIYRIINGKSWKEIELPP